MVQIQYSLEDDASSVSGTANLLEISEFDVFDVAYRAWYREAPADRLIDRQFGTYLRDGRTPFWVRHYTRATLSNAPPRAPGVLENGLTALNLALRLFLQFPPPRELFDSRSVFRA